MTFVISDDFNDSLGRWQQIGPWDSTEYFQGTSGFLTTQTHMDIANFRVVTGAPTDAWVLSGTGLTALTVGAVSARGGWPGLKLTTANIAVDATVTGTLAAAVDISTSTHVSVVLPDYNTFDAATTYIQFSSDVNGAFGTGHDSAQVFLSANTSVLPQWALLTSAFAAAGFDNTKVRGARIRFKKVAAVPASTTVSLFGFRALPTAWTESALDFDTKLGIIYPAVTLDGAPYGGTTAKAWEFMRGDGSKDDPIPFDGGYNLFFYPGGSTSPNDATGGIKNKLAVIVRGIKDTGAGTGSIEEGRLEWDDTGTTFKCERIDMTGGPGGARTLVGTTTVSVGGPLNSAKLYVFRVELVGTTLTAYLYESDYLGNIGTFVWSSGPISSSSFTYRSGRVGFMADLKSRDSFVLNYQAAPTGFAVLQTLSFNSNTPVDGAQLSAVFAQDQNLFATFTGSDLVIDATKTLSGNGSYRATKEIVSNTFIVEDWTQTYVSMAIWVANSVTRANQPQLYLNTGTGSNLIRMDALLPNQWNTVDIDLDRFHSLVTGSGYSISVKPGSAPDRALGNFWVDETVIGRRKVAWAIRATPGGLYREFRGMINQSDGAVHFNPSERGTQLQLQARALTSDAWIAKGGSTRLKPHYAPLGGFVFDKASST